MWYNIKIILNGNEGNERCKYLSDAIIKTCKTIINLWDRE